MTYESKWRQRTGRIWRTWIFLLNKRFENYSLATRFSVYNGAIDGYTSVSIGLQCRHPRREYSDRLTYSRYFREICKRNQTIYENNARWFNVDASFFRESTWWLRIQAGDE